MTNKKNDFMQKAGIATGAAVLGAAVGATAVALTDPAIKKKVVKGMNNLKTGFEEKRDDLMEKVGNAKDELTDKISS